MAVESASPIGLGIAGGGTVGGERPAERVGARWDCAHPYGSAAGSAASSRHAGNGAHPTASDQRSGTGPLADLLRRPGPMGPFFRWPWDTIVGRYFIAAGVFRSARPPASSGPIDCHPTGLNRGAFRMERWVAAPWTGGHSLSTTDPPGRGRGRGSYSRFLRSSRVVSSVPRPDRTTRTACRRAQTAAVEIGGFDCRRALVTRRWGLDAVSKSCYQTSRSGRGDRLQRLSGVVRQASGRSGFRGLPQFNVQPGCARLDVPATGSEHGATVARWCAGAAD